MRGSGLPNAKFLLQLVKFPLRYAWESCLACSGLCFGYLVPKYVKQLFLPSSGWLAHTPCHSNT